MREWHDDEALVITTSCPISRTQSSFSSSVPHLAALFGCLLFKQRLRSSAVSRTQSSFSSFVPPLVSLFGCLIMLSCFSHTIFIFFFCSVGFVVWLLDFKHRLRRMRKTSCLLALYLPNCSTLKHMIQIPFPEGEAKAPQQIWPTEHRNLRMKCFEQYEFSQDTI